MYCAVSRTMPYESCLRFIEAGEGQGHEERYCGTMDLRFLEDRRFVVGVGKKVGKDREMGPKKLRRVRIPAL